MLNELRVLMLKGLTEYEDGHRLQLETVDAVKSGHVPDTLILLEHPPVITLGKSADVQGVLAPPEMLKQQGVDVHRIERGGQATYHCPGQLVGYPIMDLHRHKLGAARYVHLIEEVLIQICARFDVPARRIEGLTGVFTQAGAKIGALGIRISKGVSYHGFALNISPDLSGYNMIVPCGLTDTPMAKVADFVSPAPPMALAKSVAASVFADVFGMRAAFP
ncbi:MAG: lipoyl(octanoyl) transferase LipB [Deltaproteobacteria bacterium]|nr:lipoyl(octanoyl) transferase LipB [Deltaproteobacteria bacterium]